MTTSKLTPLLAIAALLLVLTSYSAFAYTYFIQEFYNCSNTTIYVDVDAIDPMTDGEYELLNCTKETDPQVIPQQWACACDGNFTLVLETLYAIKNAYLLSISSTSMGDLPRTSDVHPAELIPPHDITPTTQQQTPRTKNQLTAAVIGSAKSIQPWTVGVFVGVLVLLLLFSFSLRSGGLPWDSPEKKARNLHAKAKQAYAKGEFKKAKRRYERASRLRN